MSSNAPLCVHGVWALKQGKVVRSWRRRFLRLTPERQAVVTYAISPTAPPKNTIDLSRAVVFHTLAFSQGEADGVQSTSTSSPSGHAHASVDRARSASPDPTSLPPPPLLPSLPWPAASDSFPGGARQPEWPTAARSDARVALVTPSRTYFFCLEDVEAGRTWCAALQHAVRRLQAAEGDADARGRRAEVETGTTRHKSEQPRAADESQTLVRAEAAVAAVSSTADADAGADAGADVEANADTEANADVEAEASAADTVAAAVDTAADAADTTAADATENATPTASNTSTPPTASDTSDTPTVNNSTIHLDLNGGHPYGVRLAALQQLLDRAEAAGLDRESVATEELCASVVLPATSERRCAYAELLPSTMLAPATHFVSHAWAGRYAELVAVVAAVVEEETAAGRPEPVFWVDVAVNNQHEAPQRPFSWWCGTFRHSIAAIGKVILVLSPWNDPRPLRRAWCLWEIFCAAGIGLPSVDEDAQAAEPTQGKASLDGAMAPTLDVRLPPSEQAGFERVLIEEMRAALDVLVAVQAERAEAFSQEDRDNIFTAIEASEGGFAAVNAVVKNQLRTWLVSAALQAAEQRVAQVTIDREELDVHALAGIDNGALANGVEPDAEARHAQAIEGADLFNNVAVTLHDLVDLESSAKYGERAVDLYRRLVNTSDFRLPSALQNLAVVKAAQGKLTEAGDAYREALALKIAIFGEDHPSTADTFNNLGRLLHETGAVVVLAEQSGADGSPQCCDPLFISSPLVHHSLTIRLLLFFISQGHPDEALILLKKALVVRERQAKEARAAATSESGDGKPGEDSAVLPAHIAVGLGNALNNTGQVLMQLGQLEEALDYHQRGLAVRSASLGEQHPDTASSYNDLAIVYRELGRTKDAVAALESAIAILENVFGKAHLRVATAYNNFAVMQEGAGDYEEALEGYQRSLRIKEAILSENHPSIARTVLNIGNVYFTGLRRPEETLKFYQRALAMRLAVLGNTHPDVADSHFNMAALLEYMGRNGEALKHAQAALSIYREVYSADHKDVTSAERQVARLTDEPEDVEPLATHKK